MNFVRDKLKAGFVGRHDLLAQIHGFTSPPVHATLQLTAEPAGRSTGRNQRILVITGEPGIGKSTVMCRIIHADADRKLMLRGSVATRSIVSNIMGVEAVKFFTQASTAVLAEQAFGGTKSRGEIMAGLKRSVAFAIATGNGVLVRNAVGMAWARKADGAERRR